MKQQKIGFRIYSCIKTFSFTSLLSGIVILFCSCENNIEEIKAFVSTENLPILEAKNFETLFTDSGQVRYSLKTPKLLRFEDDGRDYIEFPEGM